MRASLLDDVRRLLVISTTHYDIDLVMGAAQSLLSRFCVRRLRNGSIEVQRTPRLAAMAAEDYPQIWQEWSFYATAASCLDPH